MTYTIDPVINLPLLLLLWLAGMLLSLQWYIRPVEHRKLLRFRPWLIATRTLAWCMLLAIALRPARSEVSSTQEKSQVAIVRDMSDSMNTLDMPGGVSRQIAVDRRLESLAPVMQELDKRADTQWFGFTRNLVGREQQAQLQPDATALGEALASLASQPRRASIDCIVLISDGISNSGRAPVDGAFKLAQQGLPVHAVAVGQSQFAGQFVDAFLTDLKCPPSVEQGKEMRIFVEGMLRGMASRDCRLRVLIDEQEVHSEPWTAAGQEEQLYHVMTVPVDTSHGFHRLTVELVPLPEEVSPRNNRVSTFFKVRADGIKVLYLESVIRPEFKFLRRLIERNQDLTLTAKSPFWLRTAPGRAFLRDLDVYAYDVILIGDMEAGMLSDTTWGGMRNSVHNRGAGLAVLGGALSLQRTFFENTIIGSMMPVNSGYGETEVWQFSPRPVPESSGHFIMSRLADEPVPWERLTMQGLRNSQIRSTGTTLLADETGLPLLIVDRRRQGRVAMVATDCTWNWLTDELAPADLHPRLWTRLIYWLASRENGMTARLSIAADETRYEFRREIVISGDLMDDGGATIDDANIVLQARLLDGPPAELEVPMLNHGERYTGLLDPPRPGAWALQAHTTLDGETLSSNELRIVVYETRLEDRVIAADYEAMAAIAGRTGGQFVMLDELDKLLREVSEGIEVVTIERIESSIPLWDNWWMMAVLIVAMCADWAVRRHAGLP